MSSEMRRGWLVRVHEPLSQDMFFQREPTPAESSYGVVQRIEYHILAEQEQKMAELVRGWAWKNNPSGRYYAIEMGAKRPQQVWENGRWVPIEFREVEPVLPCCELGHTPILKEVVGELGHVGWWTIHCEQIIGGREKYHWRLGPMPTREEAIRAWSEA